MDDRYELYKGIMERKKEYAAFHTITLVNDFKVLESWRSGKTITQIALDRNCAESTVSKALRRMRDFLKSTRYECVGLPETYRLPHEFSRGKIPIGLEASKAFRALVGQQQRGYNYLYIRDLEPFMPYVKKKLRGILDELNGLVITTPEAPQRKIKVFESVTCEKVVMVAKWTEEALAYIDPFSALIRMIEDAFDNGEQSAD